MMYPFAHKIDFLGSWKETRAVVIERRRFITLRGGQARRILAGGAGKKTLIQTK